MSIKDIEHFNNLIDQADAILSSDVSNEDMLAHIQKLIVASLSFRDDYSFITKSGSIILRGKCLLSIGNLCSSLSMKFKDSEKIKRFLNEAVSSLNTLFQIFEEWFTKETYEEQHVYYTALLVMAEVRFRQAEILSLTATKSEMEDLYQTSQNYYNRCASILRNLRKYQDTKTDTYGLMTQQLSVCEQGAQQAAIEISQLDKDFETETKANKF